MKKELADYLNKETEKERAASKLLLHNCPQCGGSGLDQQDGQLCRRCKGTGFIKEEPPKIAHTPGEGCLCGRFSYRCGCRTTPPKGVNVHFIDKLCPLHAAAPDLLAAVQGFLVCLEDAQANGYEVIGMTRAARFARTAIAKAEGR